VGSESVAYILISHGLNGAGAFVINDASGVPDRIDDTGAGNFEQDNTNNDSVRIYREVPRNELDGADRFDDVVMWRTNYDVWEKLSGEGCLAP